MKNTISDIAKQVTEATSTTTALGTSTAYAYFLSADFYISLLIVTLFTIVAYTYSLINDIKQDKEPAEASDYFFIAFKGFITSLFISSTTIVAAGYLGLNEYITILIVSVFGSRPKLFNLGIDFIGKNLIELIKRIRLVK